MTDDGCYLTDARYPQAVIASVSSYHYFIGLLFKMVHYHAIVFRWFCVFGIAASGVALGWGVGRLLPQACFVQWACGAFTGLGALLYFARGGLFTPGYNALISVAVNLSALLFLLYCRCAFEFFALSHKKSALLLFQGFLIGFCLLVKAPSGVLLLFFWFLALFFLNQNKKYIFISVLLIIVGILLNFSAYFLFIQKFQDWQSTFLNGLHLVPSGGHDPKELFWRYAADIKSNVYLMGGKFFPLIFLFFVFVRIKDAKISRFALGAVLSLIFLDFIFEGYHISGGNAVFRIFQFYLFWMLLSLGAILLLYTGKSALRQQNLVGMGRKGMAVVLVGLGCFPFIGAAGTANPLSVTIMMYLASWFGCYVLVFLSVLRFALIHAWSGFILLVISFFASSQIVSAGIFSPYHLHTGFLRQNTPVSLGVPASRFLLDADTAHFFLAMKNIAGACGFKSGDDILAFLDMPGMVYALGGTPLGTAWWLGSPYTGLQFKELSAYNNFILRLTPSLRVRRAYVLEKTGESIGVPDMEGKGMPFPESYRLCGEALWPFDNDKIRFWKPK